MAIAAEVSQPSLFAILESEEAAAQRRQSPRVRVLKTGLIIFQDGNCSMPCRILNESESGAMLAPCDIFLCPKEFVLKPSVGEQHNCQVRWRKGTSIGVQYLD